MFGINLHCWGHLFCVGGLVKPIVLNHRSKTVQQIDVSGLLNNNSTCLTFIVLSEKKYLVE